MPIQTHNLRLLIFVQFVVGILITGAAIRFGGLQLGASTAVGAVLMLANMVLLAWMWHRLMNQKSIALTAGVIVIKYALLLGSIFYLTRTPWFSPFGAGLGIISFLVAAVIFAVILGSKTDKTAG